MPRALRVILLAALAAWVAARPTVPQGVGAPQPTATQGVVAPRPTVPQGVVAPQPAATQGVVAAQPTATQGVAAPRPTVPQGVVAPKPMATQGVGAPQPAATTAAPAIALPAVGISYTIDARFDPEHRTIDGRETIRWRNGTGEPVAVLPLHLYLNAFAHTGTTWMREADFRDEAEPILRRSDDPWGYDEPRAIRQVIDGARRDLAWKAVQPDDGNPLDRSLAEITLAAPLASGDEAVLEIEFDARLPLPFARTGQTKDFALVGQWYPKIGVIEPAGVRGAERARSAARQFHGATEFYADFADYDVTFAAPADWIVGATGRAQDEPRPAGEGYRAHRYVQRAVHDFALAAGRRLTAAQHRHQPKGGGPAVDVRYLVPTGTEHQVPRWRAATEAALDVLGARVGPYPYDVLTVVAVPYAARATRGMEYPTFVTAETGDPLWDRAPARDVRWPENTIVHEVAHQYFYGLLATNEQDESFLDEGMSSYWELEIVEQTWGAAESMGRLFGRPLSGAVIARSASRHASRVSGPMRRSPSWLYDPGTWGYQAYVRPTLTLRTAANLAGRDTLDRVFREYARRFAFRHPGFDDVLAVAREVGGDRLAAFLAEAFERETVPDYRIAEFGSERWEAPIGRLVTPDGPVTLTEESGGDAAAALLEDAARAMAGPVLAEIRHPGWLRDGRVVAGAVERRLLDVSATRDDLTAFGEAAAAPERDDDDDEKTEPGGAAAPHGDDETLEPGGAATPHGDDEKLEPGGAATPHGDDETLEPGGAATPHGDDESAGPGRAAAPVIYVSTVRVEGPGWDSLLPVRLAFRFEDGSVLTQEWTSPEPWVEYRFLRGSRLAEARVDPQHTIEIDADILNDARRREPHAEKAADWALWIGALAQTIAAGIAQWL